MDGLEKSGHTLSQSMIADRPTGVLRELIQPRGWHLNGFEEGLFQRIDRLVAKQPAVTSCGDEFDSGTCAGGAYHGKPCGKAFRNDKTPAVMARRGAKNMRPSVFSGEVPPVLKSEKFHRTFDPSEDRLEARKQGAASKKPQGG